MKIFTMILALTIGAPAAFVACDRTVETQTRVKSTEDGTKVEKKTVTEGPDGRITETKERREVDAR